MLTEPTSETESAAVVAAVEQFLADTAPSPGAAPIEQSRWQRAALEEGVSHAPVLAWGSRTG
jgi:hypothetical protein